jgi:predicted ribosomally synthesized peptide with nif11-like leader
MIANTSEKKVSLCPSAQPDWSNSVVFAISAGTVEAPEVVHLPELQPVTKELLALAEPVTPTEVFRFAAPCAEKGCTHFDGSQCQLVERIVAGVPTVADTLPPCRIRQDCRWWQQEGKEACFRCTQIVTNNYSPSDEVRKAATPVNQA